LNKEIEKKKESVKQKLIWDKQCKEFHERLGLKTKETKKSKKSEKTEKSEKIK